MDSKSALAHGIWLREHPLIWGLLLIIVLWLSRVTLVLVFPQWFNPFDVYETLPFALLLLGWFALLSVALVGGGIVWLTGTTWRELGWRREGLVKAIALGLLGFVLSFVALLAVMVVRGATAQPDYVSPSAIRLLLVTFFAFGIPAWVEENLFRGFIQPLLAKRVTLWTAIVIQAALFSASHFGYSNSPLQFGWLFISGLIYGGLRGRSGSLVAPYLAHALGWMIIAFGPAAF
jgi:membrane protease YdiL (CAAX protease family)